MHKPRVAVVEDDAVVLSYFVSVINESSELDIVATASSVEEANNIMAKDFDVLLVDLQLIDGSGLDVIQHCRALKQDSVRVLVISVFGDEQSVLTAIKAGADGYLLKDIDKDELVTSLQNVLAGESPISPAIAGHILREVRENETGSQHQEQSISLTNKEKAVLESLSRGLSYKDIAKEQYISYFTVADHVKSIYKKMSVHSRSEAVYKALQMGALKIEV